MSRIEGKYFYGLSIRASTVSPCRIATQELTDQESDLIIPRLSWPAFMPACLFTEPVGT
ncbi:hypothetical protein Thiowin_01698 [Thiorhodovibrio winogradskyi]|uniref:Uncharacterized protein n=1 Tax=Thiorhodovibrio winogradskyi TaxID=77007 RepID=A0ABZ0S8W0_9GAMM